MSIPKDVIDKIRNASDIIKIIGELIPLKESGRNFKALCPFHQEKTPSFIVSVDKQIFRCFGCGVGGNVFTFLMNYKKISFEEAVQELAAKAKIKLDYNKGFTEKNSEYLELINFNEKVKDFYNRNLMKNKDSANALNYLYGRKMDDRMISGFQIGYSSTKRDFLYDKLKDKYSLNFLFSTGIFFKSKSNNIFDLFSDRIIFPIKNDYGKTVAFAGRTLNEQVLPKYINSPETRLYKKSRILYAMDLAKKSIVEKGFVIIVEGYMDAIFMHKYGFENTVATCGTALTPEHCSLLKKFTDSVTLMFDSDSAGLQATLRSIGLLMEFDFYSDVVRLPESIDIDEYLEKYGKDKYQQLLNNKKNYLDFLLDYYKDFYKGEAANSKIKIIKNLLFFLSKIKSKIVFDEAIKKISEKMDIAETSLVSEFNKYKSHSKENSSLFVEKENNITPAEQFLISILLNFPEYISYVKDNLIIKDFENDKVKYLLEFLFLNPHLKKNEAILKSIDYFEDKEMKSWISKVAIEQNTDNIDMKILKGVVSKIKEDYLNKRFKILTEKVNNILNGKVPKNDEIFIEYNSVLKQLKK